MRPAHDFNATFLSEATPRGRLALVSQSGALCAAISDWAAPHHLGFSTIVSLGNAADVDFGDMLDYLAGDAEVRRDAALCRGRSERARLHQRAAGSRRA